MSATHSATKFKIGDTVVNKSTGQKVIVGRGMVAAGLLKGGHYVHDKDRPKMPRSQQARIARDFQ